MADIPQSHSNDAKIVEQQEKIFDLRLAGLSIREIARKMNLGIGTVSKRLNDETIRRIAPKSDELRLFELAKLDELEDRLVQERNALELGNKPDSVAKLASSQITVMGRRARLMGLDAPEKVAISRDPDSAPLPPALTEAMRQAQEDAEQREAEIRARSNGA